MGLLDEMSITCSSVELKDDLMRCRGRFRLKCFPRGENFPSASLVWNLAISDEKPGAEEGQSRQRRTGPSKFPAQLVLRKELIQR